MSIATGADQNTLVQALLEHTNPGDLVDLKLGIDRELTGDDLKRVGDHLAQNGIEVRLVEYRDTPWPNTLRIVFRRPSISEGYGIHPVLIIGGLVAVLGMSGFIGWSINKVTDAIAKNIVPMTLIVVAGGVLAAYVLRRKPA